ncbi:DUF2214 domain-containing protein [Pararoseomonas baculiformis]|uniref:DUF2214 domain-containing protein n=1 Tax=Pararoseomonas baculiformis TaxID=2820812 RepID=UPI0031581717
MQLLAESPVAAALRRSVILYPLANASHILGIALLVGPILALDLRLLGAFAGAPIGLIGPVLVRVAGIGLALTLLTGALLFSVRPDAYLANPAFQLKLALILAGLANILLLHRAASWRSALAGGGISARVRAGAAASAMIWVAALLAGRWIAFVE